MQVDKMSVMENQERLFISPGVFLLVIFLTAKGCRNLPVSEMGKAEECWLEGHFGNTFKMASCDFPHYG